MFHKKDGCTVMLHLQKDTNISSIIKNYTTLAYLDMFSIIELAELLTQHIYLFVENNWLNV